MKTTLQTWRLSPTGITTDLWSLSSYNGEVLVRAHNELEARSLVASRFRVRLRFGRAHSDMKSPWYVRELVRCEKVEGSEIDAAKLGSMAFPPTTAAIEQEVRRPEEPTESLVIETSQLDLPALGYVLASDVRQAIVGLLLAKQLNTTGRWLDVSVAATGDDGTVYVIIPAPKLRGVIAEELSAVLGRPFSAQENKWTVHSNEVVHLMRGRKAPDMVALVENV